MKNLIKAYLITVLIYNGVYFFYFVLPYLSAIPSIYQGYIPSRFILEPLFYMLKITLHFVALMFIIILPLFKLVTKYPRVSWIIVFLAGFLSYFIIFLINSITIKDLWILAFYENIPRAVVFSIIFAALYWWFNRSKKRASKNLADEFR